MRWDLKQPCKNCPFGNTPDRITFSCRERAEEIEEHAYRHGFPCHLSADHVEDEDTWDGESGGYQMGADTQHCAGALLMHLHDTGGSGNVPFEQLDEAEQERVTERLNWTYPVFETAEEFFVANRGEDR